MLTIKSDKITKGEGSGTKIDEALEVTDALTVKKGLKVSGAESTFSDQNISGVGTFTCKKVDCDDIKVGATITIDEV